MRRFLRWLPDTRVTLGGLASGSLVTNTRWAGLASDLSVMSTLPTVPYLDDVIAAIGSIATNTVAARAVGVVLTFLIVLAVMYQAVARLAVRETAALYATDRFRAGLVVIAGGFGLGLIAFLGGFEETGLPWFESLELLLAVWFLVSWFATGVALALWTDPTSPDNPVVALLARITGEDPATYRRSEITDTWAPPRVAAGVATLAAAIVVTLLGILLGAVVAIATLLYPLPEVSVLLWVGAQLAGIHRLPYLWWVERAELEEAIYERLGASTVTIYGVFVALAYLVALAVSTLLFATVGLPVLLSGVDSLGNLAASAELRFLASPDIALTVAILLALAVAPILAALYYVAYWILAILRLPAVASFVLPGHAGKTTASYPRLPGRTLPAGLLVLWTATLVAVEPGDPFLQALFLGVFLLGAVPTAWALYRGIAADTGPHPVDDEERVLLSAAGVQGVTLMAAFLLVDAGSAAVSVLQAVLFVGIVAGAQYFGRRLHEESVGEADSAYSSGILVAACLALAPTTHWLVPELSPAVPAVLLLGGLTMAVTHIMGRRQR